MADEKELKPVDVPYIYEMIGRAQAEGASHVHADALASIANGLGAISNNPIRSRAMFDALEALLSAGKVARDLCTPLTNASRPDDEHDFVGFGSDPNK